jgi:hypothetical protein
MTREVRQLILADGALLALLALLWLAMPGCDHTIGPAHPYQGSATQPHTDAPRLTTVVSGGAVNLVAKVKASNPQAPTKRATVTCRFELGGQEIAQRSTSARVPAGSFRVFTLSAFTGLDNERSAAVSCDTLWQ